MSKNNIDITVNADGNATQNLKKLSGEVSTFGDTLKAVFTANIITGGVSMLVDQFKSLAGTGIEGVKQLEKATLSYETLLGSQAEATKRIAELRKFANTSPFDLDQVMRADTMLQGFGIRTEQMLKRVGNVSAITGMDMQELALIMGQLSQSKSLQDIRQLVSRGVVSFKELQGAGIVFDKSGGIVNSVEDTFNAINNIIDKKFGNSMDKMATTFDGKLSTMNDTIKDTMTNIFQDLGVVDIMKNSFQRVTDFLTNNKDAIVGFFKGMGEGVKKVVEFARPLVESIFNSSIFGVLINNLDKVKSLFDGLFQIFVKGNDDVDEVAQAFNGIIPPALQEALFKVRSIFETLFNTIKKNGEPVFKMLRDTANKLMEVLRPIAEKIVVALSKAFIALSPVINSIIERFGQFIQQMVERFKPILDFIITKILPVLGDIISNVIIPALAKLVEFIMPVVNVVMDLLVGAFDVLKWVIENVVVPAFERMLKAFEFVGNIIKWVVENIIVPAFEFWRKIISDVIAWIQNYGLPGVQFIADIIGSIFQGIANVVKGVWDGIGWAIKSSINWIIDMVNGFARAVNNIIWNINTGIGASIGLNIGYLNDNLPHLAKGGIVDGSTIAMIGEAGREAVLPLENNTGGMKEIANLISANMNQNQPTQNITINISGVTDPKTVADMVMKKMASLNQNAQRGLNLGY